MRDSSGAIFYHGPSLLTGDPILGVLTGLTGGSNNPKTGPMVQAWVIRADRGPMDACRDNVDDAICGDCRHRGRDGLGRTCYVTPWLGPNQVYKHRDAYLTPTWDELGALIEGRQVRVTAYGDAAAVPFELWRMVLGTAAGWTGYTHQWRQCDRRLQAMLMASVDSVGERSEAQAAGWRTFRVSGLRDLEPAGLDVVCPASAEAGHRTTCAACALCRGTANPARSIVIAPHGNNGVMTAFRKASSKMLPMMEAS